MSAAPLPPDEAARLAALAACGILDSPPEAAFDELAQVACEVCRVPVALVSLVDENRQWFKARVHFDEQETTREISFCAHAVATDRPLIVPDTLLDSRFQNNPLVTSGPRFRFYAGVPIYADDTSPVGTLCVLDYTPRELTAAQMTALQSLARTISRELRARREASRAKSTLDEQGVPVGAGDRVGDVSIVRPLGHGGAGAVYEARTAAGERVALKILQLRVLNQREILERFAREARILAQVKSPHVARLIEVGNLDRDRGGLPYLVLEYLEGEDLGRRVQRTGPLAISEALSWVADACEGVAAAHALGIVHRDLKPSNVFLARDRGSAEVVKVLDFGIAKLGPRDLPAKLTREDVILGTPRYMPPEQIMGASDVDARSDVWSMGALLFELLTGTPPFPGDNAMAACANVLSSPPLSPRDLGVPLPPKVEAILVRCLEKERDARYPDMGALRAALLDARSG